MLNPNIGHIVPIWDVINLYKENLQTNFQGLSPVFQDAFWKHCKQANKGKLDAAPLDQLEKVVSDLAVDYLRSP